MSPTAIFLSLCQFLYMAVIAINLAFNSLVAQQLAPSQSLATVPYLFLMGTTAALVLFLPKFFDQHGYRKMFVAGAMSGMIGGLLASIAIQTHSFWLFCSAAAFLGLFQATAMYYRYAAADSVAVEHKSTAIAWVLNGGILSALLSKYIANGSLHLFDKEYLGSFVALTALALLVVPVLTAMPLPKRNNTLQASPFRLAHLNSTAIQAILFCAIGYLVMALVMLASPLAMNGCGFHASDSASVIQWHLLGMFAPSLLTGKAIARFGAKPVAFVGALVLGIGCILAMSDQSLFGFHLALAIVGIGWNLMYLGGSTLITLIGNAELRGRVQSINEFVTFAATTFIAGATGWLFTLATWQGVLVISVICLIMVAVSVGAMMKANSTAASSV
jgi:MFS family permease